MTPTLADVASLVGQLSDADQAELMEQLSAGRPTTGVEADAAVAAFRRELDRGATAPLSATELLFLDRESRACTLSMLAFGLADTSSERPATGTAGRSSNG